MNSSPLKKLGTKIAAAAVAATAMFVAAPASADQSVDWSKVLFDIDHLVRRGAPESSLPKKQPKRTSEHLTLDDPSPNNLRKALL